MTRLLTAAEYQARQEDAPLPVHTDGSVNTGLIEAALAESTGLIVMHCPFLLNEAGTDLQSPLPPQFAEGLRAVCVDLTRHRLADSLRDSEDARLSYQASLRTLEHVNNQYEVTLGTPAEQTAAVLDGQGAVIEPSTLIEEFFGPPTAGLL